jgi:homoserine kinase type II
MDSNKVRRLRKMDSLKSYELLHMAKELARAATEVQDTLENSFLREQIVEVVEGFYEVGKVVDAYEIFGGYVNRSFMVSIEKNGVSEQYFVRKYKLGITENEILFEHALVRHAMHNGFNLLAGVITARDGNTYVSPEISRNKFALYQFLQGEDKYTWDNPLMEDSEYVSAAEVLALFHSAAADFDPNGLGRVEPGIIDLVAQLNRHFTKCSKKNYSTKFHDYFTANIGDILKSIEENPISKEASAQLVKTPIHCDFHPGNLKFASGEVVGVFDFDWSKIDVRLFDICLALAYNSVYWGEHRDGEMLLDKCRLFLQSYQSTLQKIGNLSPLNSIELDVFPTMMAMANFYLLNWDISAYYAEEGRNDYEYLAYLRHNVRQMRWIEDHKQGFAEVADSVRL